MREGTLKKSSQNLFVDRSEAADARRFRHLLDGNGYFMEENMICGHGPCSQGERDEARRQIDSHMTEYEPPPKGTVCAHGVEGPCPHCSLDFRGFREVSTDEFLRYLASLDGYSIARSDGAQLGWLVTTDAIRHGAVFVGESIQCFLHADAEAQ